MEGGNGKVKQFEEPQIEIIRFQTEDILSDSSTGEDEFPFLPYNLPKVD